MNLFYEFAQEYSNYLLGNLFNHKRINNEEEANVTIKPGIYTIGSTPFFDFYYYGFLIVLASEQNKVLQIYISQNKEIAFRSIWNKDNFNNINWTKLII